MPCNFQSMSTDKLWALHDEIRLALSAKMAFRKRELEHRFHLIRRLGEPNSARRPYPRVLPKWRNPLEPLETWSGRGKQLSWLTLELRAGKQMDDFRIKSARAKPILASAL
jgi:DNA-binding protein H-NS